MELNGKEKKKIKEGRRGKKNPFVQSPCDGYIFTLKCIKRGKQFVFF